MEIYADVIFFVNFIFSYVLLYILGKFVNTVKIKKLRLAVAAVIGGISSAIIFCIEMPMWISYVLRCVAMFLMITTAYFEKRKNILNQMLWFVMLGGIMMFVMIMLVSLTGKTIGMAINNGIVYFDINSKVFAVSLGISCIMMIFVVKMFKNRKNKKYYILNVTHNDRTSFLCSATRAFFSSAVPYRRTSSRYSIWLSLCRASTNSGCHSSSGCFGAYCCFHVLR